MAFKPYSLVVLSILSVSQCELFADGSSHWTMSASRVTSGTTLERPATFDVDDIPVMTSSQRAALIKTTRADQVSQPFASQLATVDVVPYNSVVTIAPLHLKTLSFDEMTGPENALIAAARAATAGVAAGSGLTITERLCAGPDIDWSLGTMGMAAFVARGDAAFWGGTGSTPPNQYEAYQYWLLKGPHKDGDRFNYPADPDHQLCTYGTAAEQTVRLENVCRIGNLTVTGTASPFAKIFVGTNSPCKTKYTIVNLVGMGSGVGSEQDNWSFLTASGNMLDTSVESSGTKYVLKNRPIALQGGAGTSCLAMPLYHKDIDPDFGVGLTLVPDSSWTTVPDQGPGTWACDLGFDVPVSAGGTLDQGGLIKNTPVQHLSVYITGINGRLYLNPNQNLCIDSHNGKYRSWLPIPDGWSRVTDINGTFNWPGDGAKGTGRVDIALYQSTMFPAAFQGYDSGLSLWNGKRIFRFTGCRMKGGACCDDKTDYGVFVMRPTGGVNFPQDLPWVMPKVRGTSDGMFDTTARVVSVSEVSARRGGVAVSNTDHASHGITKWKIADVYPYPLVARCAGRGDAAAAAKLAKFFGQTIPPMVPAPTGMQSLPTNNICYGAMAKLRHKESGNYLAISQYAFPGEPNGLYVTCTPDKASAGWWMVAPGKNLAARAGGVALTGGEGVSLVERVSKRILTTVNALPPLSLNYATGSDSDISQAILGKYHRGVAAYSSSQLPPSTTVNSPINWIVGAPQGPAGANAGIMLQNQGDSGFLSSVNGYRFMPVAGADWTQEVTSFDSGTSTAAADAGDFGIWLLDDYVPAPSTAQDLVNAGFTGPLTTFDGKVVSLVQVALGADNYVYGVDGSQNAVRFDLTKKSLDQIATGVSQIAVGSDGAVLLLKTDGTVVLRPSGGADTVVPGCLGRGVAIGSATSFGACSIDGPKGMGHLLFNEGNQLLARDANGVALDVTDDGYVFALAPVTVDANTVKSNLLLWKKSSSSPWNTVPLTGLDQEIARVSAGSTRFFLLQGHRGSVYVVDPAVGADVFSSPDSLLTDSTTLRAPAWKKLTLNGKPDGTPIIAVDSAISSNGDVAILAGQVNSNFEFPVFMKSGALWPQETEVFNLKVERVKGVAAQKGQPAVPAQYGLLVADSAYGYLEELLPSSGVDAGTARQGSAAQFSMPSVNGYVTIQAKSGISVQNSNAAIGLNKDDQLQNRNLMTAKTSAGAIVSRGVKLDAAVAATQCAVGFGGSKFKSLSDADSVLERFMFYALEPDPDGAIRCMLQSKATGGFLMLDTRQNAVVSVINQDGVAVPVSEAQGSVFVIDTVSNADLKLQQSLVGRNASDAMSIIETAFYDQNSYTQGVESFFANVAHWLDGVRISPNGWIDFTQTKADWTDPVDKLKKSRTASERLAYLVSDASILANATLATVFADASGKKMRALVTTGTGARDSDVLLQTVRDNCDASRAPQNLGLLSNVQDGSVVALRSVFGIDAAGKLTLDKSQCISELYVAIDAERNVVTLARTTAIDPNVQFTMKVVPSPLANSASAEEGHNAADVQRWMMQASAGTDATIKRIFAPVLPRGTVDSQASALEKIILQFGPMANTSQSTLLSAYFDVESATVNGSQQIMIQSALSGGYWAIGLDNAGGMANAATPVTVIANGVSVIDSTTNELKDGSVLDLDIRTESVVKAGDGTYTTQPIVGSSDTTKYGPAAFEIVVISPVLAALTSAFKKASLDEQVAAFLVVAKQISSMDDAVTFCQAVTSYINQSVRNSQTNWNAFAVNRSVQTQLAQCVTVLKQLFADDYGAAQSGTRFFIDGLAKAVDVARVPSFGVTKSRADAIVHMQNQINGLGAAGALSTFVTSGGSVGFMAELQRAVNDWSSSAAIAVVDPLVKTDAAALGAIITKYQDVIGTSLSAADRQALTGLSFILTNSSTMPNPVDILQGIVSANTTNNVVSFGSDAKYSFMSKLWELYKSSTLDPDPAEGPASAVDAGGNIISRGDIFGLAPAQITQLGTLLQAVSKAPASAGTPGGPFFGDSAGGDVRSSSDNGGWGWKDQPFGNMTNSQIINQLSKLFVAPTFSAFAAAYLQYIAANQDNLSQLATSTDVNDQAQVQRFALRLITLAEQWNSWQKGATSRLQRQELNQFKSLLRAVKSFVVSNPPLKQRVDKLLTVVQSALDQLV